MQTALPFRSIPSVAATGPLGAREFVDRLVRQSQARPTDRILIVGGGRCGLLLELYRRGFTQVCHETGERLPVHEAFDIVWLLRVESAPALARVLTGLGRILRPDGTIVAWTTSPSTTGGECLCAQNLRQCFAASGLVPLVQASDGETGCLLTAHRPPAGAVSWPATA
ncbi:hypothetical protein [Azospirillum doebereinerae]|uniref:Class I SAM-dependent methyltransferase n=1 Tax=Azospirillum doebereinerae TaxID=92933 RepID=A0A433J5N2_9PROT|nr:hypothetical protein [Azospirillum doebereinerae]MCG5239392.1 hypothetical protein [Azospirillum doebereinerae]RUQ67885.1 hypothetical protein EJ913_19685 [Azospirillum doebereinerae]